MELSSIKINRPQRQVILLVVYSGALVLSYLLAYQIRFDFAVPPEYQGHLSRVWPIVIVAKLVCLWAFGQFASLLTYFSLPDLRRVAWALLLPSAVLLALWYAGVEPVNVGEGGSPASVPRGVILLDGVLSFLSLSMCRLGFRLMRESSGHDVETKSGKRVGIVGAGEVGAALAREFQTKATMKPVIFFDDSDRKKGTQVHGVPVTGPVEGLLEHNEFELDEVIIAMPSAPGERVREIVDLLDALELRCRTVPAMSQVALGEVITQLRPVEVGDILGRESVYLDPSELNDFYIGKTVLVTGAGGSIGSELCRQLAGLGLARLIMVDHSEYHLFEIHAELSGAEVELVPEVLDVRDVPTIETVLQRERPSVIFHAAAYKHVLLMERQPMMAIRNNVLATHQLARVAAEQGVGHFILISTDKAVAPSSVMGATKRLAEQVLQGHALGDNSTSFITVRFGNVLGSSGSVVPIFQRQIEQGGPVLVTHEAATRFFMSIPEAAGLVLRSAVMGKNRDRFILDMGQPVRIMDLAREMIRLSGYEEGGEIEIQCIGLRPGEKLHEELHTSDEQLTDTIQSKIKCIQGADLTPEQWRVLETALDNIAELDEPTARKWLHDRLPEFQPEKVE
jgi:FlaA1/EpsC-like NDP-sugar epimerase